MCALDSLDFDSVFVNFRLNKYRNKFANTDVRIRPVGTALHFNRFKMTYEYYVSNCFCFLF